jgi:actin-like ATPase involved in cell morphogenesis
VKVLLKNKNPNWCCDRRSRDSSRRHVSTRKGFTTETKVDVSYRNCKALDKSIQRIEDVMETLSQTPELAADIYGNLSCWWWIYAKRFGQTYSQKTDLPVYIAEDPLRAVVRGTGMAKIFQNLKVS